MRAHSARPHRSGLRRLIGLAAAALLFVQGVKAMPESRSTRGAVPAEGRHPPAASGTEAGPCGGAGSSSLSWWNVVLGEDDPDASTPTWWDVMLYESSR
ncbi:MAG TPA: hypothetical protein VJ783_19420 [Pirellulales bacterium]|nr:hypothetical protein [Pirellulales bacterium]